MKFTREALTEEFGYPFSEGATRVARQAGEEAHRLNKAHIAIPHLFLALCRFEYPLLNLAGIDTPKLISYTNTVAGKGSVATSLDFIDFTYPARNAVMLGINVAKNLADPELSMDDMFLGLAQQVEAATILERLGVSYNDIRGVVLRSRYGERVYQALQSMEMIGEFLRDPQGDDVRKRRIMMQLDQAKENLPFKYSQKPLA